MKKFIIALAFMALGLIVKTGEAKADQFFTSSSTGVFVGTGPFTVTKVCWSTGTYGDYFVLIASYPGRTSAYMNLASYDKSDWIMPKIEFSSSNVNTPLVPGERCIPCEIEINRLDSGAVSAGPSAGQDGLFLYQATQGVENVVTIYTGATPIYDRQRR